MTSAEVLADAFGRVREVVHEAVADLSDAELGEQLDPEANSISWLVWHLTRVQDDHVAEVAGWEQVWAAGGWAARFELPFAPGATGYGQGSQDVAAVRAGQELLLGYYDAVHAETLRYVAGLSGSELNRIVGTRWGPPVTLGVRLVSVAADDLQHAGQAAFLRGWLLRRRAR